MRILMVLLCLVVSGAAQAAPVRFEAEEIIGEVQKPEITVYIGRENLSKAYKLNPLKESFLSKITEAVKKAPF